MRASARLSLLIFIFSSCIESAYGSIHHPGCEARLVRLIELDAWEQTRPAVLVRVRRTLTARTFVRAIEERLTRVQEERERTLMAALEPRVESAHADAQPRATALARVEAARREFTRELPTRLQAEAFDPATFEVAEARLSPDVTDYEVRGTVAAVWIRPSSIKNQAELRDGPPDLVAEPARLLLTLPGGGSAVIEGENILSLRVF